MIEILPNWHPVFVHFTIALLSMSVVFYLLHAFLPQHHRWHASVSVLAKTNLWLGSGFAIITALAGWFAYNSVAHDTPSHAAMTDHRNWALVTLAVFIILTVWSVLFRAQKKAPVVFVIAILIAGALLAVTGWKGAESVYRYGLGVMSLPQSTGEGHDHQHADGEGHGNLESENTANTALPQNQPQSIAAPPQNDSTPHQHEGDTSSTDASVSELPETNLPEQPKGKSQDKNAHDSDAHTH